MHTIDLLMNRRSIRKFKDKMVPWDNIVNMCNCALHAPISGNVHNVKFIIVRDGGNRKAIADACHNQAWIARAPLIIVVVAEPEHQERLYGRRGAKLYTIQNAAAAAMSIITAAESLGLGSCWVGSFEEEKMRSIIGAPEHVNIHVVLPIGFPDEKPTKPPKQWLRATCFMEKWWSARKLPAYGYYSENVQKGIKGAGKALEKSMDKASDMISKGGKKAQDSFSRLKDKLIDKKKSKEEEKK